MTIAHSLITKLLIEKWSNNPALDVRPGNIETMANDAAEAGKQSIPVVDTSEFDNAYLAQEGSTDGKCSGCGKKATLLYCKRCFEKQRVSNG